MTVRSVELLMAVVLALLSIAIMVKATDGLSIRWVPGTGPGSGVWPFWLSALMLLSCLTTILMFGIPIFIFFFFEYLLTIPLPKGEWIPDQVYLPLYRIMYGF